MSASVIELVLLAHERRVIVSVIQSHPDWTLGQLFESIGRGSPRAEVVRSLTISELLDGSDLAEHQRARRAVGDEFDRYVLRVLEDAGQYVGTGYVGRFVGGPRWKLQASFRRLEARGEIERRGRTSATRYRAVGP